MGLSTATNGFLRVNFKVYEETLPNGAKYLIQERFDDDSYDNTAVFQVPDGHYFMMGDNRHNSEDSRFWGFVPYNHILGEASFIWFSYDYQENNFLKAIRWERFLKIIN